MIKTFLQRTLKKLLNFSNHFTRKALARNSHKTQKFNLWKQLRLCSGLGITTEQTFTEECTTFHMNGGTAVNVQSMVFGNLGDDSGTGVAFSRNPATGENQLYGE